MGRVGTVLLACVFGVAVAAGCSVLGSRGGEGNQGHQGAPDGTGTIGAELTLPGGEHLSSGNYTLTNGTYSYAGAINITATNTLSFTITSVVAGGGYMLTLTAGSDDGTITCNSTVGPITVANRTTTSVAVALQCTVNQGHDAGSLAINGTATNCPVWNTIVANPVNVTVDAGLNVDDGGTVGSTAILPGTTPVPADIDVGQSLVLIGGATAPNPGLIAFNWSTTGGSLSSATGTNDPNSNDAGTENQTIFTCPPVAGTFTITMTLTDGPIPPGGGCDTNFTTGTVTVNCQAASAPSCGAFGTGCGDGGQICNAAGSCVPALFSVVVLTSLDGGMIPNNTTGLPVSIQEYTLGGTPMGAPVALPQVASGSQQPITIMGNDITEGDLTTSVNGRYLSMTGWATAPGTGQLGQPVVARIDALGNVDTSTVVTGAFQTQSPFSYRSAVSNNGNEFWVSGVAFGDQQGNTGGIWYVPFGTTTGTQVVSLPDSNVNGNVDVFARWLRIYNGQLYSSSDELPPYMFTVGSGLPTSLAPIASLGLADTVAPSPYGFLFFNLSGGAGPDTLYIADDGVNPVGTRDNGGTGSMDTGGAGLSKWTFSVGTGWTQVWNITSATWPADAGGTFSGQPIGFRGLAGFATGTTVTLMATTGNVQGMRDSLTVVLVDDGGPKPTPQMVAQSPINQVFRGIALTPQ